MGGRGASSGAGGWTGGNGNSGVELTNVTSLVSAREEKLLEVDETLQTFKDIHDRYEYVVDDLQLVTLIGKGSRTLAYYDGSNIAFNQAFFDKDRMEKIYGRCVQQGFHPPQGDKTALQAVASHEIGHALTDKAIAKMGGNYGKQDGAEAILAEAIKSTRHNDVVKMAGKISGYAKTKPREAIAEAFADVYCNGNKAHEESQAIVSVMNKYLKK